MLASPRGQREFGFCIRCADPLSVNVAFSCQAKDGYHYRILAVVDDFTRVNLVLVADTSLSGRSIARELDKVIAERGMPKAIASDNGTELNSMAILKWVQATGIDWHFIAPGKP